MQNSAVAAAVRLTQSTGLLLCCSGVELLHSVLQLSHWNHGALLVGLLSCRLPFQELSCVSCLCLQDIWLHVSQRCENCTLWCPAPGLSLLSLPELPLLLGRSVQPQPWLNTHPGGEICLCLTSGDNAQPKNSGLQWEPSGKIAVNLLFNSMQAVGCWWVILGWKRTIICELFQPRCSSWMSLCSVFGDCCLGWSQGFLPGSCRSWLCCHCWCCWEFQTTLWNPWKTKALFVLLISGLCCHSGFLLTDRSKIKANLWKSRNGTFRLINLYCVWQMGG